MVKKAEIPAHVVATAMSLAAERGWRRLSLAEIARGSGLSLAQLYERFPSKASILRELSLQADAGMLAAAARDADRDEESIRDRLFDVVMARFDVLEPHKDGIAAVLRDGIADPVGGLPAAMCWGCRLLRSMGWALEAAGVNSSGPGGTLKAKALMGVYVGVMPVWLRDDSPDMAKTMAALDQRLARAERLVRLWPRARREPGPAPEEEVKSKAKTRKPASKRRKGGGGAKPKPSPA
ncbi:MAG: TetR family transcriptional regulator [Alphaproteobacteria bacterium]|nr:TetR family transcriptional regulator [Alphaproteobacteria bacterium]